MTPPDPLFTPPAPQEGEGDTCRLPTYRTRAFQTQTLRRFAPPPFKGVRGFLKTPTGHFEDKPREFLKTLTRHFEDTCRTLDCLANSF